MLRDEILKHLKTDEPYFIIASMENTDDERWGCEVLRKNIGTRVRGVGFHREVERAIQIELEDGQRWYMNYKDLIIFDVSLDNKNESFFFEPENLCL